jgi:ribosomal protein S6E (S10)
MLGLGLESTSFPRPLHIFDNLYSLELDGVSDMVRIPRDNSMLGDSFTVGLWIGDADDMFSQYGAGHAMCGNTGGGGWTLEFAYKKFAFSVVVQDPTDGTSYEGVITSSPYNRYQHSGIVPTGHVESFSTGLNEFIMVVAQFHNGTSKLFIGGGTDNNGNGMGNDVYEVDTASASNGGEAVSYGAKGHSRLNDMGVGGLIADQTTYGANANGTSYAFANCSIDNFFYFNDGELPIATLKHLYNNGAGNDMLVEGTNYSSSVINSLKCHIRFGEGSGATAADSSSTGNNSTLLGDPDWSSHTPSAPTL